MTKSDLKGHFFKGHDWTTSLLFECFTGAPVKYAKTHTDCNTIQYWVLLCSLPVYASCETGNIDGNTETKTKTERLTSWKIKVCYEYFCSSTHPEISKAAFGNSLSSLQE